MSEAPQESNQSPDFDFIFLSRTPQVLLHYGLGGHCEILTKHRILNHIDLPPLPPDEVEIYIYTHTHTHTHIYTHIYSWPEVVIVKLMILILMKFIAFTDIEIS
jgi:hypothetical protein